MGFLKKIRIAIGLALVLILVGIVGWLHYRNVHSVQDLLYTTSWVPMTDVQNEDFAFSQKDGKVYVADAVDPPYEETVFPDADPQTFLVAVFADKYQVEDGFENKIVVTTSTALYAKDKTHVYWFDMVEADPSKPQVKVLTGADPATFEPIFETGYGETEYAKDKGHVYFYWQLVTGADPQTFVTADTTGAGYDAYDKNHTYQLGKMVQ